MPNLFGRQPANHNIAVFASKTPNVEDTKSRCFSGQSWLKIWVLMNWGACTWRSADTHRHSAYICGVGKDLTAYSLGCRYCWPGDKPFRGAKLGAKVVLDLTNTRSDRVKVQNNLWAMNMWWYPGDHWIKKRNVPSSKTMQCEKPPTCKHVHSKHAKSLVASRPPVTSWTQQLWRPGMLSKVAGRFPGIDPVIVINFE